MAEIGHAGGVIEKTAQAGAANTPLERLTQAAKVLNERVQALPAGKRSWLIVSVLFIVAACVTMAWYAGRPDWRVLFSGLEGRDIQQVSQELAAAGIPYQASQDGAGIEVPAQMLDKARMEVAAKGMPQTGRMGFELFDKPNWVGSEFDERVNYQRAMEGELEHTIGTLDVVKSARVHLVLPQPSLFTSEEKAAKASVVLKLRRGSLDQEQVEAIRSLIAGSVENLNADQVTLVDADGRVNFKQRSNDAVQADAEAAMEAKLVTMLEPLVGRDNVRATVNITYDQDTQERTDEVYDPTEVATLSMQKTEQLTTPRGMPSGVPGTASNSPAASAEGAVAGSQAAAAPGTPPLLQKQTLPVYPTQNAGGSQSVHEENGTYGVSKHMVRTEMLPGRVRRVSAAVVVNDRSVMDGSGKFAHMIWKPRSAEEMRRIEQLAQAAVGFDGHRGDEVVVEDIGFSANTPETPVPPMEKLADEAKGILHSEPGLVKSALIGLCGIFLVIFVLRPMVRDVTTALKPPALLHHSADEFPLLMSPDSAHEEQIALETTDARRSKNVHQGIFDQVSDHIRREPTQSTRLIEAWIGTTPEVL